MSIYELNDDLLDCIIKHNCLKDQRNLATTCTFLNAHLKNKLLLYKNEVDNILHYIRVVYNNSRTTGHADNILAKHIVFREKQVCVKITFDTLLKLKFIYKTESIDTFISEKLQANYYFTKFTELIVFIYTRILNCNMYSNTMLFSQKYNYYKIY